MFCKKALHIVTFLFIGVAVGWVNPETTCPEETGDKTVELESGLYYTIVKGDTLWDLSEHFYDSPWVWPNLWEQNQEIPNPHWIYPGQQVRIFSREELQRMAAPVKEPEPEVALPPPPEPSFYFYAPIDRVGFVRKEPASPSGTIFKVKEDKGLISQMDLVYVQPAEDCNFKVGDRFTVFRTLKPLKDPDTRKSAGIQHFIVGLVEISDVQPEFSVGRILESYREIKRDDLLMPYEPRSPNVLLTEGKEGFEGKILAAEEHQTIFADLEIAFINKGRNDGVEVGQSYSVYYQEAERIRGKEVLLTPVNYGKILVLLTEENTATAVVTHSERSIKPGATIHAASP
jgi:hypothetical protein